MMCRDEMLTKEFIHFRGQPVRVFTDDERVHFGFVAEVFETAVRVIKKNGCPELIEFGHIAAIDEPQMRLCKCETDDCGCHDHDHHDRDRDDCGHDFDD